MPSLPCNSRIASILTLIVVKSTITLTRLTVARRSCQRWWKVRRESRSTRSGLVEILGIAVDAGLALRSTMSISIDMLGVGIL